MRVERTQHVGAARAEYVGVESRGYQEPRLCHRLWSVLERISSMVVVHRGKIFFSEAISDDSSNQVRVLNHR
jgi:hypothetical protein